MVNLSSKVKFLATRKSVDSDLFHGNENINNVIFLEDKERDVKKKFFLSFMTFLLKLFCEFVSLRLSACILNAFHKILHG